MAKFFVTWALLEPAQTHKALLGVQRRDSGTFTDEQAQDAIELTFPGCTLYETREYTGAQIQNQYDKMVSTREIPLIRVSTGVLNNVSIDTWVSGVNAKFPDLQWSLNI